MCAGPVDQFWRGGYRLTTACRPMRKKTRAADAGAVRQPLVGRGEELIALS